MKEYANNLFDIIENISYEVDRYNIELSENIPKLMEFVHQLNPNETSDIYRSIGFIIGKSESIFFDHIVKLCMDVLRTIDRKNRILKNQVISHTGHGFKYSKDALDALIQVCNDANDEDLYWYKDNKSDSVSEHYKKLLKILNTADYKNYITCDNNEMLNVIGMWNAAIYNVAYNKQMQIYFSSSKDSSIMAFKEIITCMIASANFILTISYIQ